MHILYMQTMESETR